MQPGDASRRCRCFLRASLGALLVLAFHVGGWAAPPAPSFPEPTASNRGPRGRAVHWQEHSHEHGSDEAPAHAEAEEPEHDHADHGEEPLHGFLGGVARVGRLHPMWVHFPIAFLLLAAVAEAVAWRGGNPGFSFVARVALWAGAVGAWIAAALGWADAVGVGKSYTGVPGTLLLLHRWAGTLTALVAWIALVSSERYHRHPDIVSPASYRAFLFASALLVVATGHLGASLIFGWDSLWN